MPKGESAEAAIVWFAGASFRLRWWIVVRTAANGAGAIPRRFHFDFLVIIVCAGRRRDDVGRDVIRLIGGGGRAPGRFTGLFVINVYDVSVRDGVFQSSIEDIAGFKDISRLPARPTRSSALTKTRIFGFGKHRGPLSSSRKIITNPPAAVKQSASRHNAMRMVSFNRFVIT